MRLGIKNFPKLAFAALAGRVRAGRLARRLQGWKLQPWAERLEALQLLAAQKLGPNVMAWAGRRARRGKSWKFQPWSERLEALQLLAAQMSNVISGFVYLDRNSDNLFDQGDTPIANNTISLRNSAGTVVGTTVTDANGFYTFSTDSTISTAPATVTRTVNVGPTNTDFSQTANIPQFDSSLGTLTSVDVNVTASLTSDLKAENTSTNSPADITATVSGTITTTAPGLNLTVPLSAPAGTFHATTYDGKTDFAGSSGHDFGNQTASNSQTVTLTDQASLANFTGPGTVPATVAANATSSASAPNGNLTVEAATTGSAQINVTYHYTPKNTLAPGTYTIIQVNEPPGTTNGRDSSNGTVLPPNTGGGPDTIPVVLTNQDSPNNNFGELTPTNPNGGGKMGGGGPIGPGPGQPGPGQPGPGQPGPGNGGQPGPGTGVPGLIAGPLNVIGRQRLGIHHQQTRFVLYLNQDLLPGVVRNTGHYRLVMVSRNGQATSRPIPLTSAVYNAANRSIVLTPSRQLNVHYHYRLTVTGLTDTAGVSLTGTSGVPGGPYVTLFSKDNLTIPPSPNAVARAVNAAHNSRYTNGAPSVRVR